MSNRNLVIQQVEAEQMKKEIPEFGPGDTVVVQVKAARNAVLTDEEDEETEEGAEATAEASAEEGNE